MKALLLSLMFASAFSVGAQRISVQHSATDTVKQGETFTLTYAYENLPADGFALPELVGLLVVGGPSRQTSMQIANGVRTSASAFTYRLMADQAGLAYIPSLTVEASDSTYTTAPITLFVTDDPDYVTPSIRDELQAIPPTPPKRRRPTVKM